MFNAKYYFTTEKTITFGQKVQYSVGIEENAEYPIVFRLDCITLNKRILQMSILIPAIDYYGPEYMPKINNLVMEIKAKCGNKLSNIGLNEFETAMTELGYIKK
jgi:hypothetical protein